MAGKQGTAAAEAGGACPRTMPVAWRVFREIERECVRTSSQGGAVRAGTLYNIEESEISIKDEKLERVKQPL